MSFVQLFIWINYKQKDINTFCVFFLLGGGSCRPAAFLSAPVRFGEGEIPRPGNAVLTWGDLKALQCMNSLELLPVTHQRNV